MYSAAFLRLPDSDLVSPTNAAPVLGISRNDIKQLEHLGLKRYPVMNSFAYRVGDIRAFLLEHAEHPDFLRLQAKKLKAQEKAQKPSKGAASVIRQNSASIPSLQRTDERDELADIEELLEYASWPLGPDDQLQLRRAHEIRSRYPKLKRPKQAWWMIEDAIDRDIAHRKCRARILQESIQFNQRQLAKGFAPARFDGDVTEDLWRKDLLDNIAEEKKELSLIEQCP